MRGTVHQPREVQRNGVSEDAGRVPADPAVLAPAVPRHPCRQNETEERHHRQVKPANLHEDVIVFLGRKIRFRKFLFEDKKIVTRLRTNF